MLVCRSKPNTNAVEQSGMGWLLNPGSCFPLTITGVGQETAQAIKAILEMSVTTPRPALTCLTAILEPTLELRNSTKRLLQVGPNSRSTAAIMPPPQTCYRLRTDRRAVIPYGCCVRMTTCRTYALESVERK